MSEQERLERHPAEMGCACDTRRIAERFDAKARDAGTPPALHATSRALLDLVGNLRDRTVLEIGSGQGGLLLAMLESGAAHATGVDVSSGSIEAARERLARSGLAERATLLEGNGATIALAPHDVVVLDRAICCYPDAEALVRHSAASANSEYAFSVPNSRGWRGVIARVAWGVDNFLDRFRRCACPGFIHDLDRVEGLLAELGFERRAWTTRGMWYVGVFERRAR